MIRTVWTLVGFLVATFALTAAEAPPEPRLHEFRLPNSRRTTRLTLVVFNEAAYTLRLIDNATPEGRVRFKSLGAAMEISDCTAGCNGGFYIRKPFEPFGLMISDGKSYGSFDPKSWMNGLVVMRAAGATLEPASSLTNREGIEHLLQSGPWLVRKGEPVLNLDPGRQAARTIIAHDTKGNWALGMTTSCSLAELAPLLKQAPVTTVIDIQEALNLDGGPSSGLWLRTPSQSTYLREGNPVRNYLGVSKKK